MDTPRGESGGALEAQAARRRSLEAELATDAAAEASTAESHHLAVDLHVEAAKWCRRVAADRRAHRHEVMAKLHAQLAARLLEDD